jgi:hypothetical protein
MAALAFQSITVGRARFMAVSRTGIELARMAGVLCRTSLRPQSVRASAQLASSRQATTASGRGQRLTNGDSDKGAAIIPIDAQPLEQTTSEEPLGGTTERTSEPPPLAGPAAGCGSRRAPETSFEPLEPRRERLQSIRNRVSRSQFGRSKAWLILLQRHVQARDPFY